MNWQSNTPVGLSAPEAVTSPAVQSNGGVPSQHLASPGYGHGFDPTAGMEETSSFSVVSLLNYALRYRWLIAFLACIGFGVGLVTTWMQTPKYRATVNLELLLKSAKVFRDLEVVADDGDRRAVQTAMQRLKSRSLAERTAFELGLANKAEFLFPRPDFAFTNILNRIFGTSSQPSLDSMSREARERLATSIVQHGISTSNIRGTSIVRITYSNPDPTYATLVTNQLGKSYIDQRIDQNSQTSVGARDFVKNQVVQSKVRLQKSEEALLQYAKEQNITVTGEETSLIANSISAINKALSEAVRERLELARSVEVIGEGQGASMPEVIDSEGINRLRERRSTIQAEYQRKLVTLKPGFPEMRQLRRQINAVSSQIKSAVNVIHSSIKLKYQAALNKEKDLQSKLKDLEVEQASFQDKRVKYSILKREVDSNRTQYDALNAKLNEVGVGSELRNADATIIDEALRPRVPFEPSMKRNVALSILAFLMVAAFLIYVIELLNNTFSNPEQIEEDLKLPVLGVTPYLETSQIQEQIEEPTSAFSEAYRSIRTALQFSAPQGIPSTLLVTSGQASEGKSTTSFQIARNLAALNMKVLLIDADMRKPSVHRQAGMSNIVGLSNILANAVSQQPASELFKPSSVKNLTVLTAGTIPPNPVDLLASPRMGALIGLASQKFEVVIVDAPPVIGLSDAIILSRIVDATIVCVSANQVTRKGAQAAVKRLRFAGGNIIGAIMTKFNTKAIGYGDSYSYMNYEYYAYGGEPVGQITKQREASGEPKGKIVGKGFGRLRNIFSEFADRLDRTKYDSLK